MTWKALGAAFPGALTEARLQVHWAAQFVASAELSRDLIDGANGLRYLRNPMGAIDVPFRLKGGLGNPVSVQPDMAYLGQRIAPALLGDMLGKLVGKKKRAK